MGRASAKIKTRKTRKCSIHESLVPRKLRSIRYYIPHKNELSTTTVTVKPIWKSLLVWLHILYYTVRVTVKPIFCIGRGSFTLVSTERSDRPVLQITFIPYIGETRRRVETRLREHQEACRKGTLEKSAVAVCTYIDAVLYWRHTATVQS